MKNLIANVRKTVVAVAVITSVSVVFMACLKDKHDMDANIPPAGLMAFNLAPDKPSVGFALSGSNLADVALDYTNYTGGYIAIFPGQREVEAYDSYRFGSTIARAPGNFASGKYYSVFLVGVDSAYKNVVVADNIDSLSAAPGKALIRYINAIPDSVSLPLVTITAGASNVVNGPAAFASVSAFIPVNAGEISVAAKNNSNIDISRKFSVEQSKIYTILLLGVPGSTTIPAEIKYITNGTLEDSTAGASSIARNSILN